MKTKRDAGMPKARRTTGQEKGSRRGVSGPEPIEDAALGAASGGRDLASGQASGKRQWAPVRVLKDWGST